MGEDRRNNVFQSMFDKLDFVLHFPVGDFAFENGVHRYCRQLSALTALRGAELYR
jgi:hypothetical protein